MSDRRARGDPEWWRVVELAQRGRMILDVTAADLEAAEAAYGAFHPTTWHFRNAWYEAQRSWDRLRAEVGGAKLKAAIDEPPRSVLALGPGAEDYGPDPGGRWPAPSPARPVPVLLIPIAGQTYRAQPVAGTPLAPSIWRLTHLGESPDGPYFVCRLRDGSTQCDCAEWTYRVADAVPDAAPCKHLAALASLGWMG